MQHPKPANARQHFRRALRAVAYIVGQSGAGAIIARCSGGHCLRCLVCANAGGAQRAGARPLFYRSFRPRALGRAPATLPARGRLFPARTAPPAIAHIAHRIARPLRAVALIPPCPPSRRSPLGARAMLHRCRTFGGFSALAGWIRGGFCVRSRLRHGFRGTASAQIQGSTYQKAVTF